MAAWARELRWIVGYRVASVAVVALLLHDSVALAGVGALALASVILWSALPRAAAVILAGETLAVLALAGSTGGPTSPLVLLLLPLWAHAALVLPTRHYASIALASLAGLAALGAQDAVTLPAWAPFATTGLVSTALWLGITGALLRREREAVHLPAAPHHAPPSDAAFWHGFLGQLTHAGGLAGAALVRFEGDRPEVVAAERAGSWRALVARQQPLFGEAARGAAPRALLEAARPGSPRRAIVLWPIPRRGASPAGVLCLLAATPVNPRELSQLLTRYLPSASLALALRSPALAVHHRPVAWDTLMDATLQRLEGRLARYLVLVQVEPGLVEADEPLLAGAIARVIEAVLDVTPPRTPVRLDVRLGHGGWHFRVETEAARLPPAPTPALMLARQVVAAHGGVWEQAETATAHRVGFVLPAASR